MGVEIATNGGCWYLFYFEFARRIAFNEGGER